MIISNAFKKVIKNTFYDKEVLISKIIKQKDEDYGDDLQETLQELAKIQCNVQDTNSELIYKQYGIKIDAEKNISFTEISIDIEKMYEETELMITYKDKQYKVKKLLCSDSHYNILAKKE